MAFCTECGNKIPDSGKCTTCNPPETEVPQIKIPQPSPQKPLPPPQTQVNQTNEIGTGTGTPFQNAPPITPQQNIVYVKAPPNPIFTDSLAAIRKIFSSKPQEAVTFAVNSKNHIWIILAGFNILMTSIVFALIPGYLIKNVLNEFIIGITNQVTPALALFGVGFLLSLTSFFVLVICIKVIYSISKFNIPFIKVMNLVSSSHLISSITLLCAIVFSFFFIQLSLLLIIAGVIGSILLLYTGLQSTVAFKSNIFWAFLCILTINLIILFIFSGQLFSSIMKM